MILVKKMTTGMHKGADRWLAVMTGVCLLHVCVVVSASLENIDESRDFHIHVSNNLKMTKDQQDTRKSFYMSSRHGRGVRLTHEDRCSWLHACLCRNESDYTNGSYKLLVNCTQAGLNAVPQHIPNTTTVLTLDGNAIQNIQPEIFRNLINLKYLDLSNNNISYLSDDVFDGLGNLHTLELSGNKLRYNTHSIPRHLFKPLRKLERLNIHQNINGTGKDEAYPTEALLDLKQLEHLLIDGLQLEHIDRPFPEMTNLRILDLSSLHGRCNMSTISVNMFRNLSRITNLYINNCNLNNVEMGSFSELRHLTSLDMSYNENLHFKCLANITYGLRTFHLTELKLVKIHSKYGDCTRLEKKHLLYMNNMTINDIYLDANRLAYITTDAVEFIPKNVHKLSLTNNMLLAGEYLQKLFQGHLFQNLTYLTLAEQDTNFDVLEIFRKKTKDMIQANRNSDRLGRSPVITTREKYAKSDMNDELTRRTIENTPNGLQAAELMVHVQAAKCGNCHKNGVQYDIVLALPPSLKDLDLSGLRIRNELRNICICQPNRILRINLERNIFWKWHGPIAGLSKLLNLNLAWNSCESMSVDVFDHMTSLIQLNLTHNFIGRFLSEDTKGRIFRELVRLEYLLLSDNKLQYIPPKLFQGLASLRGLDLSYNFLTHLDVEFDSTVPLQYLDLSNNVLNGIGPKIMDKFDDVAQVNISFQYYYIDLSNNELSCTCNDTYFVKWISTTKVRLIQFETYTCRYEGGEVKELSKAAEIDSLLQKVCAQYTALILLISVGLILFLVIVACGVIYRYRWDLRYFYYSIKLRMNGYHRLINQEHETAEYQYDAFVSYAGENGKFVKTDLVPELEDRRQIKLLVHDRDFRAGEYISDNIMEAITKSRKTLILMSKAFLRSDWCIFEMNMARMEEVKTGRLAVCLIMLEDVPSAGLPLEIMDIIRQQTYIELPAECGHMDMFWDRVCNTLLN